MYVVLGLDAHVIYALIFSYLLAYARLSWITTLAHSANLVRVVVRANSIDSSESSWQERNIMQRDCRLVASTFHTCNLPSAFCQPALSPRFGFARILFAPLPRRANSIKHGPGVLAGWCVEQASSFRTLGTSISQWSLNSRVLARVHAVSENVTFAKGSCLKIAPAVFRSPVRPDARAVMSSQASPT